MRTNMKRMMEPNPISRGIKRGRLEQAPLQAFFRRRLRSHVEATI